MSHFCADKRICAEGSQNGTRRNCAGRLFSDDLSIAFIRAPNLHADQLADFIIPPCKNPLKELNLRMKYSPSQLRTSKRCLAFLQ